MTHVEPVYYSIMPVLYIILILLSAFRLKDLVCCVFQYQSANRLASAYFVYFRRL